MRQLRRLAGLLSALQCLSGVGATDRVQLQKHPGACAFAGAPRLPVGCVCRPALACALQPRARFWARPTCGVVLALSQPAVQEERSPPEFKETIFAQGTPVGMGGIAVVRVSGPQALAALQRLSKPGAKPPTARYATLRTIVDPMTQQPLDSSLVLFFPGPRSFTGEDVVEIHCHGGIAIVTSILDALSSCPGLRLAQRGEFTKRAYLNGNMDLLEAEALNDLIHAETRGQQKQALQQMAGAHRKLYQRWRTDLVQCMAHVNAFIDYGDNDGIEEDEVMDPTRAKVRAIVAEMRRHLADGRRGESIRSGLRCTLIGPPNAGKSSLLNVLAGRPAAIVSSVPGTTRDIVQVRLDVGGLPLTVDDTAGLRAAFSDEIEREGMRRSAESFRTADVRVLVLDGSALAVDDSLSVALLLENMRAEADREREAEDAELEQDVGKDSVGNWGWSRQARTDEEEEEEEEESSSSGGLMVVLNKKDLHEASGQTEADRQALSEKLSPLLAGALGDEIMSLDWISCSTREGVEGFIARLGEEVQARTTAQNAEEAPLITRARHRELIKDTTEALDRFLHTDLGADIQAEELSIALESLGQIYGAVEMDEMLDVVFRDFCIGK